MSCIRNKKAPIELDVRRAMDQLGVEPRIREPLLKRLEESVQSRGGERRDYPKA
ncbi:hypothetical protein ACTHPH_08725 [Paenibacillus pasadenensis]|uniref:hypothetical protein n=1 Tax=Paenibacillus pasadenensis TaxID=217090 RepID=UPI00040EC021|nr:hypothetical protein [Paenibacillus pasadenensis]